MIINNANVNYQGMSLYVPRLIENRAKRLFRHFPAVAVTGPRQVGKSTLLNHLFPKAKDVVVFDPILDVRGAKQDPELFVRSLKTPCILDEIQYVPKIVPVIKRRIDEDRRPGQFLITGSQQWAVMRHLAESMAGRIAFCDLLGFSAHEIAKKKLSSSLPLFSKSLSFSSLELPLHESLWRGFFPESQNLPKTLVPDFFTAYQRTYIERDARIAADISDWQRFVQFMRLCAALTSQEINYSQLGRDIDLNPQTAKKWLGILNGTWQWIDIPAYSGNAIKRISEKPKGYLHDSGLICALQSIGSKEALAGHPMLGAIFETAVIMEIRKQFFALGINAAMYHWRLHSGAEVDLIIEKDGIIFPIEIKCKSIPGPSDCRGLQVFRETYQRKKIARGLVICPCKESFPITKNDWALPWDAIRKK